jgi:uncharacterized protein
MRKRFVPVIVAFMLLFAGLNYYVGLRGWQWLTGMAPKLNGWVYWLPFWAIACAFLLSRFSGRFLPRPVTHLLTVVGSYWLTVLQYALPLLLIIDAGRLLHGWFSPAPFSPETGVLSGGAVFVLLGGLVLYGSWSARNPVVVRHRITIPKRGGKHRELHVVLVSDTHLGAVNDAGRLRTMVRMVGDLQPDLILIGGDLIDDDLDSFVAQDMPAGLRHLQAPLGVYSVLGNHDAPRAGLTEFRHQMERSGIHLLVDEWVQVDESLYVIGRDDLSGKAFRGRPPMPLAELLTGVDTSLPLLLMDHQPSRLDEAQQAGIDLLVSGHTHRGQMFPYQYITRKVFEVDWGYLRKGAMHVIVSLGFGTWGPPVRIGNRPEVVSIQIRFA